MKNISLIISLVFTVFTLNGVSKTNDIMQYTIEDGLSHNKINCIFQDSYGYLWIGTNDGLNRYDGYNFIIYRYYHDNSLTISNNIITSISEDEYGNIWVGTYGGLNKYLRKSKTFLRYFCQFDNPNSLTSNYIQDVLCDKNGFVWIKTDGGFDKLNIETGTISNFSFYVDVFNPSASENSSSILKDKEGRFWIGTKDGLNYFNSQLELFERHSLNLSAKDNNILKVYQDKSERLWLGTMEGLYLFDPESKGFTGFLPAKNDLANFSNIINDIYEDRDDNLWICTQAGLYVFQYEKKKFIKINDFVKDRLLNQLNSIALNCIIEDESEILWIGTSNYGMFKYDKKGKKFGLYQWTADGRPIFTNNNITSVYLENNMLWVGTYGEGLHILNRNTGKLIKFNTQNSAIISDYITTINTDSNGIIWIGTLDGINLFNKQNNNYHVYKLKFSGNSEVFSNNAIYSILETSDSRLWVATKNGLHLYNNGEISSYYYNYTDSSSLPSNIVYSLVEDNNRNLWIGTSGGISIYNLDNNTLSRFIVNEQAVIEANSIYKLLFSGNEDIWIGTTGGLLQYSLKDNKIANYYTQEDGLPSNIIYSIEEDNNGDFWVGTYNGLAKLDMETNKITAYDIGDGLQSYEFAHSASFKSKQGELFFGGIAGLNYFFPDSIKFNENVPEIMFTSFEIYDHLGPKEIPVIGEDTVFIEHNKNHFSIEFAALDYTRPEKCKYSYKMEGIDEGWINSGNVRKATFSNIPPGTYIFRIRGSNNDNVWNNKGTFITIIVEAPFYRSTFAWILYFVCFILIVFLLFQYRTRNLRESNKALKEKEISGQKISQQREELMLKNKSITDSINYAKRIQEAIMPSEKFFKNMLPASFVLYMPKDIVSGDFFWIDRKGDKVFIAVVDCTGHGIPGAFMSIIGHELLRNITVVQGVEDPSLVLNKLNLGVTDAFRKEMDDYSLRDGMDIAFCVIDKKHKTLEFAGAFNPIYVVRDNKIVELKADRNTVGLVAEKDYSFSKHIISLDSVDMIYVFTDGYTDQFGGPEEKKFKFRRFRHLLLTIHKLTMAKQKLFLKESIEKWKGGLEQVDDILIIGFNPMEIN